MADAKKYPYTTVPNNLRRLLNKIPSLGAPPKATQKWLAGIGFTGGNNQTLLPVLRHLGVIDSAGAPTPIWTALRSGNKAVFAEAIRDGYPDLFDTYPDAHEQGDTTLQTFFRTHTGLGEKAQSFCVRTFKVLVEFGDFSKAQDTGAPSRERSERGGHENGRDSTKAPTGSGKGGDVGEVPASQPLALTVNLQIELPPSADGDVYDKLFAAMGKHLKGLVTPPK